MFRAVIIGLFSVFGLLSHSAYAARAPIILVFGDSLSAGYGLPMAYAWPSLLADRLRKEQRPEQVVNASVTGETSYGGRARLQALLQQHKPRVVVLELGANDGLRGMPVPTMKSNLQDMINQVRKTGAQVVLVGMRLPPNFGPTYTAAFERAYHDIAREHKLPFVPFLLDGFAERSEMFQGDGVHPVADAQPRILDTVWKRLWPVLRHPL